MKLSGGYQDIQYIHVLIMDSEFEFMENLMSNMMEKISQIIKPYKGDPDTPTLTKETTGPYKDEFIQSMNQYIKELGQHGTWTIVPRNSVTGAQTISSTWAFKIKCFPDGRVRDFKARFYARGDRKVEGVYQFEKYSPVVF